MRIYYDNELSYPYLQQLEALLTAKGFKVPKFDSAMTAGPADEPTFIQLYDGLKCVGAYGRGFGKGYMALTDVPDGFGDKTSILVSATGRVIKERDKALTFRGEALVGRMTNEQKLRSALLRARQALRKKHHRFDHDTEKQADRCVACRLLRDIDKTLEETEPNAPSAFLVFVG